MVELMDYAIDRKIWNTQFGLKVSSKKRHGLACKKWNDMNKMV